jgi:hypothetical protein
MVERLAWCPVEDLSGAAMADKRHARRVESVARRAMAAPGVSFPKMMHSDAELEGAYRLFGNPSVRPEMLLEAHFLASAERCRMSNGPVVIAHDTTDCCFGGEAERDGVGKVKNNGTGISIHAALAVAPDGAVHGLVDLTTRTRFGTVNSNKTYRKRPPAAKESARWGETADRVMKRVDGCGSRVVHVMDREADSYVLLEQLIGHAGAFVVRLCHNRRIADPEYDLLREALSAITAATERDASLSPRSDKYRRSIARKIHPARASRIATLMVGGRAVTLVCDRKLRRYVTHDQLTLNVVRVWEPAPPEGEAPIEWVLVTNLPVDEPAQLEAVVDAYRLRWTIEEYFKALKTGCAFEERQLESRHALENALAILAPIACQMLHLRSVARRTEEVPASEVLTATQIEVLRAISVRYPLPENPTAQDALLAIAGLGGFLKRNGQPGWQTIGRGYEDLLLAEAGWKAAKRHERSDQS